MSKNEEREEYGRDADDESSTACTTTASPVRCKLELDEDDCVKLSDILISFNAAISEEHAWALCYQCGKCFKNAFTVFRDKCRLVKRLDQVLLHKDGYVHEKSIISHYEQLPLQHVPVSSNDSSGRTVVAKKLKTPLSELKLLTGLGYVIFQALDFGIEEDEERAISPQLEKILNLMIQKDTSRETDRILHAETDDEGIERDSGDCDDDARKNGHGHLNLESVLELCENHVGAHDAVEADVHYRAVCRALVAEILELSSFLEKVSEGTNDLHRKADTVAPSEALECLNFQDWARLWMQVIRELRHGVKLKKVVFTRTPIEYELTPYEILMEDIRSRRYKLNKVTFDGSIPARVKKDAHAIILEFIRSRPPLKKASDRQLPPKKQQFTPRERLLESIKQGNIKLRRSITSAAATPKKKVPYDYDDIKNANVEYNRYQARAASTRRLIKVDFSTIENAGNDEDDEDDEDDVDNNDTDSEHGKMPFTENKIEQQQQMPLSSFTSISKTSNEVDPVQISNRTNTMYRTAYDLAMSCPARKSIRRHTIVSGAATWTPNVKENVAVPTSLMTKSVSRDDSIVDTRISSSALPPPMSWSRNSLQEELFESKQWRDECLSLTLEEIVHIRSVLTKAELESLPVEGRVKEDVEKRKICFLCLKTRFSIFGPWGHICRLCKRTVCGKCNSKMKIPTEHFSHVPVVALSPTMVTSTEHEYSSTNSAFTRFIGSYDGSRDNDGTVGTVSTVDTVTSTPDIPKISRLSPLPLAEFPISRYDGVLSQPRSFQIPYSVVNSRTKLPNRTSKVEKLKGVEMIVCMDCKTMVKQIIKSSRTSRCNANEDFTLPFGPIC